MNRRGFLRGLTALSAAIPAVIGRETAPALVAAAPAPVAASAVAAPADIALDWADDVRALYMRDLGEALGRRTDRDFVAALSVA